MTKLVFVLALAACGGSKSEPAAPANTAGSGSATVDGGAAAYHQKVLADMTADVQKLLPKTTGAAR